jgi:hypothetical protein
MIPILNLDVKGINGAYNFRVIRKGETVVDKINEVG